MANPLHPFEALLRRRVVVLDGAMGTTLQRLGLTEADFRGQRFRFLDLPLFLPMQKRARSALSERVISESTAAVR